MLWTEIQSGKLYAAGHQFLTALGGNADEVVNRINSDPTFVANLAKFAQTGGYESSTSHVRAREIMGKNMLGLDDAIKHFGVQPTKQQLAYLAEIPFSEEILTACKDTHVLVAVPTVSILDIRSKVSKMKLPTGQKSYFYKQDWYDKEPFASAKGELGWHLIRKTPVENSTGKNWDEQQALLGKDEETPTAQVMVYTTIAYFLVTGERLFEETYVRISSLDSGGDRVYVGGFAADGLYVDGCWDGARGGNIGVASARK